MPASTKPEEIETRVSAPGTCLNGNALAIDLAVYRGFTQKRPHPVEFGGDMGTLAIINELPTAMRSGGPKTMSEAVATVISGEICGPAM